MYVSTSNIGFSKNVNQDNTIERIRTLRFYVKFIVYSVV